MESIAEKFVALDESGKAFIAGYMAGKQEAQQYRERDHRVPELEGR
ncbi:MAG: hypothetical protein NC399_02905 [Muribaculum sp.]|nr:hypothetical protein [Muribaculum sp.]